MSMHTLITSLFLNNPFPSTFEYGQLDYITDMYASGRSTLGANDTSKALLKEGDLVIVHQISYKHPRQTTDSAFRLNRRVINSIAVPGVDVKILPGGLCGSELAEEFLKYGADQLYNKEILDVVAGKLAIAQMTPLKKQITHLMVGNLHAYPYAPSNAEFMFFEDSELYNFDTLNFRVRHPNIKSITFVSGFDFVRALAAKDGWDLWELRELAESVIANARTLKNQGFDVEIALPPPLEKGLQVRSNSKTHERQSQRRATLAEILYYGWHKHVAPHRSWYTHTPENFMRKYLAIDGARFIRPEYWRSNNPSEWETLDTNAL